MWLSDLLFRGSAKIELASYTYIISTYLFPRLGVIGYFNIWSVYIFWFSFTSVITRSILLLFFSWIGSVFICWYPIFLLVVVYCVCFLICVRRPYIVDSDLVILLVSFSASSGHVLKIPRLTDFAPFVLFWAECRRM